MSEFDRLKKQKDAIVARGSRVTPEMVSAAFMAYAACSGVAIGERDRFVADHINAELTASPVPAPDPELAVVEELERLDREATPGEWFIGPNKYRVEARLDEVGGTMLDGKEQAYCIANCWSGAAAPYARVAVRNAALIVALRNAAPRLLAALRSRVDVAGAVEEERETIELTEAEVNWMLNQIPAKILDFGKIFQITALLRPLINNAIRARGETKTPEEK